jgi:hypothetical protein
MRAYFTSVPLDDLEEMLWASVTLPPRSRDAEGSGSVNDIVIVLLDDDN